MEKSLPHCLRELLKASEFSDNVRGEAPDLRAGYKAYYDGAGRLPEISVDQLKYVLEHATPAGKLYAAILLCQTKAMNNEQCYAGLLKDKAKVKYASGCEVFTTDVATIAKSLKESGKYLGFQPVYFCSVPLPPKESAGAPNRPNIASSNSSNSSDSSASNPHASSRCPVKTGMTRKETEKYLTIDGGISVPFSCERFIIQNAPQAAPGKAAKVDITFKPAGMSDAVYHLGKWTRPKQSPDDTVMKVSPVYVEPPYYD